MNAKAKTATKAKTADTKKSAPKPSAKKASPQPSEKSSDKPNPVKPVETPQAPVGPCPQGGEHTWTQDADGKFCGKCKEPHAAKLAKQPQVAKASKAAKPAKVELAEVAAAEQGGAAVKSDVAPKPKKLGCVDAAAQVLAETKQPMSSKELIATMAAQKLWTSPAGQTPHATLYSAILREISGKGSAARFVKTERGKFAAPGVKVAKA